MTQTFTLSFYFSKAAAVVRSDIYQIFFFHWQKISVRKFVELCEA